jgi:N-carbamoylputrescine amidase
MDYSNIETMKITVCQLGDETTEFRVSWDLLVDHAQKQNPDLILLPEMAFFPWFSKIPRFDPSVWKEAVEAHEESSQLIQELSSSCVLGTRPLNTGAKRLNQAFVWNPEKGFSLAHTKYHLPDEEGFWEASWYHRGNGEFKPYLCQGSRVGFLICTDMWFFEHSRLLGKEGVQLVACPRATPKSTLDKWLMGGRAVSVVSGAFCISSNKYSPLDPSLGGLGWVIDPEGRVLGVTSETEPILTVEIDLSVADRAKHTYPRYVLD